MVTLWGKFYSLLNFEVANKISRLWHTHARPDRDSHISIIWDEIPINGYEMERHKKLPNDTIFREGLTEEYDYDSLMHMPEGKKAKNLNLKQQRNWNLVA